MNMANFHLRKQTTNTFLTSLTEKHLQREVTPSLLKTRILNISAYLILYRNIEPFSIYTCITHQWHFVLNRKGGVSTPFEEDNQNAFMFVQYVASIMEECSELVCDCAIVII